MDDEAVPDISVDVTELLVRWSDGDEAARADLMAVLYEELRARARNYLRRERADHTLQPTALVHEAYLRLINQNRVQWRNRAHFFGVASQVMRRILLDHARRHQADKRGGGVASMAVTALIEVGESRDLDLIRLDDALTTLAELDPRQSRIVELRFFGGLSVEETAEVLGVSVATVMREWKIAKLWLFTQMQPTDASPPNESI